MINMDADPKNADWTKRTFDFVPMPMLEQFIDSFGDHKPSMKEFINLPVWQWNRKKIPWVKQFEEYALSNNSIGDRKNENL